MTEPTNRASGDSAGWMVVAALIATMLALELARPFPLALRSLASLAYACIALGAAALFYRRVRPNEALSVSCVGLSQALLFSAAGSILSYLLARSGGALWDPVLSRWDKMLGFDWLRYVRFVDGHSFVRETFRVAYASLIPQTIMVILALGFRGRLYELRTFVLAAMLSGITVVLLSPLFPAVGNFAYLRLHPSDFQGVWQWSKLADVRDFLAVRNGSLARLDLRTMEGIIVFPSYHAALATVTLFAFARSGLMWLRVGGSALALATIASTPVFGGHYLVDVLAGIAIAIASIAAARRLVFVQLPALPLTALPSRRSHEAFGR